MQRANITQLLIHPEERATPNPTADRVFKHFAFT